MTQYKQKLQQYLDTVLEFNGSDLHLSKGKPPMVRIDSLLYPIKNEDALDGATLDGLINQLLPPKENMSDKTELDFSYTFEDKSRFRVNVYKQQGHWSAALRVIPQHVFSLEELHLPPSLAEFTKKSQGLLLVVGPAGHGKTTTLASLLDEINRNRQDHIVTIEDPIEYVHDQQLSLVAQREVSSDTGSFSEALRSSLRQDPDVLLVGEMRDLETISTALTIAETGHLVMSTLHTNDAAQTIDRIIDVFPPHQQNQVRVQLASTLLGIVSQRLVPRIGGGRIPAVEILKANGAVRNMIREGKTHQINSIIQTGGEEGMIPLNRSLVELVNDGFIEEEYALFYSNNEADLKNQL